MSGRRPALAGEADLMAAARLAAGQLREVMRALEVPRSFYVACGRDRRGYRIMPRWRHEVDEHGAVVSVCWP